MKKVLFLLSALFLCNTVFPQELKVPDFYKQREIKAPPAVRNNLLKARKTIAEKRLQFVVGYTSKAEIPLEKITGLKQLPPAEQRQFNLRMKERVLRLRDIDTNGDAQGGSLKGSHRPRPKPSYVYGNPSWPKLDLRDGRFVSPVKDQGSHGSCWAFSAIAAYESSFKIINNQSIDASEQQVINCSGAGTSAHGGWMSLVFDWMVDNNTEVFKERDLPYTGDDGRCPSRTTSSEYYAVTWGAVEPTGDLGKIPTVAQIKTAICRYGALPTALFADDMFRYYVGGVYSSFISGENENINHAVTIIGWNDSIQCWLIKNSWGQDWGNFCSTTSNEFGYGWVRYDSNNIGKHTIWVKARKADAS